MKLLQAKDVAEILNCSPSHVYQLDKRGLLKCSYKWPTEATKGLKAGSKPKEMKRWTLAAVEEFLGKFKNKREV